MDVQSGYSSWSSSYDTDPNPTRDLDAEATRECLGQLRFSSILEIGCGTGKNTALLAQISERVQALDFTEAMLELARAKVRAPNVTFMTADLTQPWPCADHSVDLVVGNLVLEHIADLSFIFGEARRCLAPGGMLFVCELHPARQYQGLQANFTREEEKICIPAFLHHLTDYLDAASAHGFVDEQIREWWHTPDRSRPPLLLSLQFR